MKSTSDGRVAGGSPPSVFIVLPCDIYPEFVQKVIQDVSLVCLRLLRLVVGFLFVHSIAQQSLLLATFEIDFLLPMGVATYKAIIVRFAIR